MIEHSALFGRRIVNTRPKKQAPSLTSALTKHGAEVVEFPMIEIVNSAPAVAAELALELERPDTWLLCTSANGLDAIASSCDMDGILKKIPVAVIGEETANFASQLGLDVQFIAAEPSSGSFGNEFVSHINTQGLQGRINACVLCGDIADPGLVAALKGASIRYLVFTVYKSCLPNLDQKELAKLLCLIGATDTRQSAEMMIFTSAQAFRNLLAILNRQNEVLPDIWHAALSSIEIAAIGAKTAGVIKECGFDVCCVADRASVNSLVDKICEYYKLALKSSAQRKH